jgi:hypothetical protein
VLKEYLVILTHLKLQYHFLMGGEGSACALNLPEAIEVRAYLQADILCIKLRIWEI